MKKRIFIILFLAFPSLVFANPSVDYLNKTAFFLTDLMSCLNFYHKDLYKNPKNLRTYTCSENHLTEKNVPKPTQVPPELQNTVKAIDEEMQNLIGKMNELNIYIRLEDYKKDEAQQGKTLFVQILQSYSRLHTLYWEAEQKIKKPAFTPQNPYEVYAKHFETFFENQKKFLQMGFYQVNQETTGNFPYAEQQANYQELRRILSYLPPEIKGLEYRVASTYFLLKTECEGIILSGDDVDYSGWCSYNKTPYTANSFYQTQIKKLHQAIEYYHEYLKMFRINRPAYLTAFPKVVEEGNGFVFLSKITVNPYKKANPLPYTLPASSAPLTSSRAAALNRYVRFINESVGILNDLLIKLSEIDRDIIDEKEHWILRQTWEKRKPFEHCKTEFKIPFQAFQEAIESKELNEKERKLLENQAQTILNILQEIQQRRVEFTLYLGQAEYQKDNFEKYESIKKRMVELYDLFSQEQNQLYVFLEEEGLQTGTDSWKKGAEALRKTLNLCKKRTFEEKEYFTRNQTFQRESAELSQSIREGISREYENLAGLKKEDSYKNPFRYYEEIHRSAEGFVKMDTVRPRSYNHYWATFAHYNGLVKDYNDFLELTSTPLLLRNTQVNYFWFDTPQIREVLLAKEKERQDWREKNNAARTQNTQNQELKNEIKNNNPIQYSSKDTVRIIDVLRIETRRVDTVYVQTQKSDTVYLTNDPDFLNLKDCATNQLVLLLDVSGSMKSSEKLPLFQKSLNLLLKILRSEDKISAVTYAGKAQILFSLFNGSDKEKIEKKFQKLDSKGQTVPEEGLEKAFELADKQYLRGGNNRVIMVTDGEFTASDKLKNLVQEYSQKDIGFTVFDFSRNPHKQLQQLAESGKGFYLLINRQNIDSQLIKEAKRKKK